MSLLIEKAREQVARAGKQMLDGGLVTGSWGNISARVPKDDVLVITPSGLDYARLRPQDMVVVGMDGRVIEGDLKPSTELPMHLGIYRARPDVEAIVHTHSPNACALAVARVPLPVILEEVAQVVGGPVAVADYAPAGSEALAQSAVRALAGVNAVLLANHGVVGVGRSVSEALQVCRVVERAAGVYLMARLVGGPVVLGPQETESLRHFYITAYGQRDGRTGRA
ncbi:MAG: class II aldolase/adducin family protein [Bacillota bacterium]|nr:class II aldolase/adducin family protein [Bacillota bacterium]